MLHALLSDYKDRNFGKNWGMLIEELQLLARGTTVRVLLPFPSSD